MFGVAFAIRTKAIAAMKENDSPASPGRAGNAGEIQQQPRVQVESTPPAATTFPMCRPTTRRPASRWAPAGREQAMVVKTKTKKLPIFITALAGWLACGALLVIALIMSGTPRCHRWRQECRDGRRVCRRKASRSVLSLEDTTLAEAASAKAPPSVSRITATSSGGQNGSPQPCRRVE